MSEIIGRPLVKVSVLTCSVCSNEIGIVSNDVIGNSKFYCFKCAKETFQGLDVEYTRQLGNVV